MTTATTATRTHDRARLPDRDGWAADEHGVRVRWEVYNDAGSPTLVLLPSAPIVHSRQWKGQVPYLSRSWRVVTYDGRGNGRSDRPFPRPSNVTTRKCRARYGT